MSEVRRIMGKTAFIFPGQGAQVCGMGQDFYENSETAKAVFDRATELLGFSVPELCFEKNDRLDITEYTQAAMVTTSVAMMKVMEERGIHADVAAGLSLGEYCALVAAGVMTADDAIRTVRERGILMQEAVPAGVGGMSAVLGMTADEINAVVDEIPNVQVANYNCPGQIVISGLKEAVETAAVKLKEAGARRVIPLNVSGPFHSYLLEEAGELFPVSITISIPAGVEAAKKTFNPVLGIEGGISVLGTSGIVEPMSEEALVETIRTHLNVLKAEGRKWVIAVPGNMGAGFLERYLVEHGKFCTDAHQGSNAADTDAAVEAEQMAYGELSTGTEPSLLEGFMNSLVTMSNFVGKTIDLAAELGFSGILIAGHMGKLVKIGNGIMNTHSREADGRMDTMLSCALSAGTEDLELLRKIQRSNTTDEAMDHLKQAGIIEDTINVFLKRADWHLTHRSRDEVRTGMIVFGTKGEYLGETEGADAILRSALKELDQ